MERAHASAGKPEHVTIEPKRMGFEFDETLPRHWFDGDPVVTHLLDALSFCFPDGERFFVDSVRAYRDRVTDEAQRRDIAGFIGQEMMHGMEHAGFNRLLSDRGYAAVAEEAQRTTRWLLKGARIRLTSREKLAMTAALEHVTAVLASTLLAHPETIEAMHPMARTLWIWHSVEEIEHKSVAFDVYDAIDGRQMQRKVLLVVGTIYLAVFSTVYASKLMAVDGTHRKPLAIVRGLHRLFGRNGIVTRAVPEYLEFFRDDFHPWQHANEELVTKWRAELARIRPAEAPPASS
jgi:uncharacterized protein